MELSKRSVEYLKNLRLYLMSSGKKEQEIEELIGELEDHLLVSEKNGKNIDDIIGLTPKEYMEQLAKEMEFDFAVLFKYVPMIILGGFSYILLGDAINGRVEYSILQLIGYLLTFILILCLTAVSFKFVASNNLSKTKERLIFMVLGMTPILLFICIIYLNRMIETPTIHFGTVGNIIAIIIPIVFFISIAIWSKTWISIILPILLFLPEVIINTTDYQKETKLLLKSILPLICIGIFMVLVFIFGRNKANKTI